MMHRAWSSIVEVPCCFSRSYVKFQGHTALKIVEFDPNWAFPDCNSSLNSPMAMKCCTKLETAKVTQDKTSPIFTQIGRFRTIGRSQLSNPSDLPCFFRCQDYKINFSGWLILFILENFEDSVYLLWYHVQIWQVSLQPCCSDSCQIWMWLNWTNKDINKSSNVPKRGIIERILSNPHKRAK